MKRGDEPTMIQRSPSPDLAFGWVAQRIWIREIFDWAIKRATQWIRIREVVTKVPQNGGIRAPWKYEYLYEDKSCIEKNKKANHGCKARWTNIECLYYNVSGVHFYEGVVNCDQMQCAMSEPVLLNCAAINTSHILIIRCARRKPKTDDLESVCKTGLENCLHLWWEKNVQFCWPNVMIL